MKQVCRASREGNITAGLQNTSQPERWRQQSIWMSKIPVLEPPQWGMQPYQDTATLLQDRRGHWKQSCAGLPKSIPGLPCTCPLPPSPDWSCSFLHSIPDSGPFSVANRPLRRKLWGKSQELILGDGTD